jgi:hypothetical protein
MVGSPGHRMLRVALAAVMGVPFLACGVTLSFNATPLPTVAPTLTPLPTGTAAAPSPGGWTQYTLAEDGLALALPPSWQQVDLDHPPAPVLRAQNAREPGLAAIRPAIDPETRFFAFDLAPESVASEVLANLSVVHRHLATPATLAEFASANARQLAAMAGLLAPPLQEDLQLPAGPAVRLRYQLAVDPADPGRRLALTQLLLVHGQEGYVVTLATAPAQAAHYEPVFDQIGRSLHWLPAP